MLSLSLRRLAIRSMNRVTAVGAMHDVQTGFLDKYSVLQFALTCSVLDFQKGKEPLSNGPATASPPAPASPGGDAGGAEKCVSKEQYIVRCLGSEEYTEALKNYLEDGNIVRVIGRLKTVEALDAGKKQLFPCIIVDQGRWCTVTLVHSSRKQRRDWQLQNMLNSVAKVE